MSMRMNFVHFYKLSNLYIIFYYCNHDLNNEDRGESSATVPALRLCSWDHICAQGAVVCTHLHVLGFYGHMFRN